MVRLKGEPFEISLIQCCAPTADNTDDEIDRFYDQLKKAIKQCRSQDIRIVKGDFNAKVGRLRDARAVGPFGLGQRNDRGSRFVAFIITWDGPLWYYPEAILGLGLKPRPNVGFKLRNNTSCCIYLLFNPKTKTKSLRTEYIILTQYMTNDRYIDRHSTLPGKGVYYAQQNST